MRTYLIIANQTLGGDALRNEIVARMADGPARFHVVVPATPVTHKLTWDEGESVDAATERLGTILDWLRGHGAEATGEIGDHDPVQSARDALLKHDADAIILSTLPVGISRWIGQDVPSRLRGAVALPVTVVTAAPAPSEAAATG
jgi:hypothetical protein